jgi:hypothetical protein
MVAARPVAAASAAAARAAADQGHPGELEQVRRLTALGAEPMDVGQGRPSWQVMRDPEGNAFCVLSSPPGP